MGMTKHREPNMVKWVGVRPGHNGEQILKNGTKQNGTLVLYTVPANKILLLDFFHAGFYAGAAGTNLDVAVRNDAAVVQMYLARHASNRVTDESVTGNLYPPLEMLAAWDILLTSSGAARTINCSFHGILIDA